MRSARMSGSPGTGPISEASGAESPAAASGPASILASPPSADSVAAAASKRLSVRVGREPAVR